MTIPPEFLIPTSIALLGAGATWVRTIEAKVNVHEAVISKLDKLIDMLLEDRLERHDSGHS